MDGKDTARTILAIMIFLFVLLIIFRSRESYEWTGQNTNGENPLVDVLVTEFPEPQQIIVNDNNNNEFVVEVKGEEGKRTWERILNRIQGGGALTPPPQRPQELSNTLTNLLTAKNTCIVSKLDNPGLDCSGYDADIAHIEQLLTQQQSDGN